MQNVVDLWAKPAPDPWAAPKKPAEPAPADAVTELVDRRALRTSWGIQFGDTALWTAIQAGRFPKPITIGKGARRRYWIRSELEAWVREQVARRDGKAA